MSKPAGATHVWQWPNGSFRAYLKVAEWVSADTDKGWVVVAKHIDSLSGKVVKL